MTDGRRKFQSLPCEVNFTEEGDGKCHITSYINNVHLVKHKAFYTSTDEILSVTLKAWNNVLVFADKGRKPLRIRTYGEQWAPAWPDWASGKALERMEAIWPGTDTSTARFRKQWDQLQYHGSHIGHPAEITVDDVRELMRDDYKKTKAYIDLPVLESDTHDSRSWYDLREMYESLENCQLGNAIRIKFAWLQQLQHPEPGISFSYEDWRMCRSGQPVVTKTIDPKSWYSTEAR